MWWLNFNPQVNPQFHWPFSGSVTQDIHPSLLAKAGNDDTELRVLREVASYGKQIGVLSDLLLSVTKDVSPDSLNPRGAHALTQLREMVADIELIKNGAQPLPSTLGAARDLMHALMQRFPELEAAEVQRPLALK